MAVIEGKTKAGGCKTKPTSERPTMPPPKPQTRKMVNHKLSRHKTGKDGTTLDEALLNSSVWVSKDNYTVYHTNGKDLIPWEQAEKFCKDLADIEVFFHDSGMMATHNMPCPVCKTKSAVYLTGEGYFNTCNDCQAEGYSVVKVAPKKDKKFYEFWK